MQCFGSFTQSVLQRNLCHANQPMGGVNANPLSRQAQCEEKFSSSNKANQKFRKFLILNLRTWHFPELWMKDSSARSEAVMNEINASRFYVDRAKKN